MKKRGGTSTTSVLPDVYVIEHFSNTGLNGPVQCSGSWLNQFTLTAGGVLACNVDKKRFALTDTYRVHVAPGMDVLLFVGIACAIDRIHHEVQDEHMRRRTEQKRRHHHER